MDPGLRRDDEAGGFSRATIAMFFPLIMALGYFAKGASTHGPNRVAAAPRHAA